MPHTKFVKLFSAVLCLTLPVAVWASPPSSGLELTESELQWLEDNPTVSFTGDPNWLPYEAFDNSGQYIGIVSEHLKLIAELTGIRFMMSQAKHGLNLPRKPKVAWWIFCLKPMTPILSHIWFLPKITYPTRSL